MEISFCTITVPEIRAGMDCCGKRYRDPNGGLHAKGEKINKDFITIVFTGLEKGKSGVQPAAIMNQKANDFIDKDGIYTSFD